MDLMTIRQSKAPARYPFRNLVAVLRVVRGGGGGLDILIGNTGGDRLSPGAERP
jgi:hypothetical protein